MNNYQEEVEQFTTWLDGQEEHKLLYGQQTIDYLKRTGLLGYFISGQGYYDSTIQAITTYL